MATEVAYYAVQLDGHGAIFVDGETAKSPDEALKIAKERANSPGAKHIHTEVFKGQSLHEVIRG